MAYFVSQEGQELLEDAAKFCSQYVDAVSAEWDRGERHPTPAVAKMQELGYPMLTLPEELGGLGVTPVDVAAVLERIAYSDAGLAVSLAGNALAVKAVMVAGNQAQKEKVAKILADGGIGAFCLTESSAGSDAFNIETKALPTEADDGYVLNGTKLFVTNGSIADFYCVVALEGESELPSLFLVEKGTEGFKIGPEEEKMGLRSCSTCSIILENCRVGKDALMDRTDHKTTDADNADNRQDMTGTQAVMGALIEGRLWISAVAIGVAQRALDEAAAHAKERIQFGKALADHQAVRMKLADMKIQIEAARCLTEKGLNLMERGECYDEISSAAKAFAAEAVVNITNRAMDIFGGYGYTKAYPIEKLMRDARAFPVLEGTTEVQKMMLVNYLLQKNKW